jgi:hypothetical protein
MSKGPSGAFCISGNRSKPISLGPDLGKSGLISVNLLLLSSRFKTICPQPETGKKAFVVGGTLKVPTIVLPACLAT